MGFDFEGCEIEKGYFDLQNKRFEEHINQIRIDELIGTGEENA